MKIAISGSRNTTPEMQRAVSDLLIQLATKHRGNIEFLVGDANGIDATVIDTLDRINHQARAKGMVGENEVYVPYRVFGAGMYRDRQTGEVAPNKQPFRNKPDTGSRVTVDGDYRARDRRMVDEADLFYAFGDTPGTQANFNYARKSRKPAHQLNTPGEVREWIDTRFTGNPRATPDPEAPAINPPAGLSAQEQADYRRDWFGNYGQYTRDRYTREMGQEGIFQFSRQENLNLQDYTRTGNLYSGMGSGAYEAAETAGLLAELNPTGKDTKQLRNIAGNYAAIRELERYPSLEAGYEDVNRRLTDLYENTKPWERTEQQNQQIAELQTQKTLATRLLQATNPNNPYWQLRYAVSDLQHGATNVTSATQNFLAARVHEQYVKAYGEVMGVPASELAELVQKTPNFLRDFARENPEDWKRIEQRALGSEMDLSSLLGEQVTFTNPITGRQTRTTFGQLYPQLRPTLTTAQVGGAVTSSILKGILKRGVINSAHGENFGDVISNIAAGAQGALAFYTPQLLDNDGRPVLSKKTGRPYTSGAARFLLRQGEFANTAWRRREQAMDSLSVGLTSGDDEDSGDNLTADEYDPYSAGGAPSASDVGSRLDYLGPDESPPYVEDPTAASEDAQAITLLGKAMEANPHTRAKILARGAGDVLKRQLGFEFTTPATKFRNRLLGPASGELIDDMMQLAQPVSVDLENGFQDVSVVGVQPGNPDEFITGATTGTDIDVSEPISAKLTRLQAADLDSQLTAEGSASVPVTDSRRNVITLAAQHRPGPEQVGRPARQFWQEVVDHFEGKRTKLARAYHPRADELNADGDDAIPVGLYAPIAAPYNGRATYIQHNVRGHRNTVEISPLATRPPKGQEDQYRQVRLTREDVERWGKMYNDEDIPGGVEGKRRFELLRKAINQVHEDIGVAGGNFEEMSAIEQYEDYQQARNKEYLPEEVLAPQERQTRFQRHRQNAINEYTRMKFYDRPHNHVVPRPPARPLPRPARSASDVATQAEHPTTRPGRFYSSSWSAMPPRGTGVDPTDVRLQRGWSPKPTEAFPEPTPEPASIKTVAYPDPTPLPGRMERALRRMHNQTNKGAAAPPIVQLQQPLDPKVARYAKFATRARGTDDQLPPPRGYLLREAKKYAEDQVQEWRKQQGLDREVETENPMDGPQWDRGDPGRTAAIDASMAEQRDRATLEYHDQEYDPYDQGDPEYPDYRAHGVIHTSYGDKNRRPIPADIVSVVGLPTPEGTDPGIPTRPLVRWVQRGGEMVAEQIEPHGGPIDREAIPPIPASFLESTSPGQGQVPPIAEMTISQRLATEADFHRPSPEPEHTADTARALVAPPGEQAPARPIDTTPRGSGEYSGVSMQEERSFSWRDEKEDGAEDDVSIGNANDDAYDEAVADANPGGTMANVAAHVFDKNANITDLTTVADAAQSTAEYGAIQGMTRREEQAARTAAGASEPPELPPDDGALAPPPTEDEKPSGGYYTGGGRGVQGTSSVPPWTQTYSQWSAGRSDARMGDFLGMLLQAAKDKRKIPAGVVADTLKRRHASKAFENPRAQALFDEVSQIQTAPSSNAPGPVGGAGGHQVPTPGGGHAQARAAWNPRPASEFGEASFDTEGNLVPSGGPGSRRSSDVRTQTPTSVRAAGPNGGGGRRSVYPNPAPQSDVINGNNRMLFYGLPGSGKTYAQAARATRLVNPADKQKKIFLAMTQSARRAMGEQINAQNGTQLGALSTFHHLGYQILQQLSQRGIETTPNGGRVPIFDPDNPLTNIVTPLEQMMMTSETMEAIRTEDRANGVTSPFVDPATHSDVYDTQVQAYTDAMEEFRSRGFTLQDIRNQNPELQTWYRSKKIDPAYFERMFTRVEGRLQATNRVTTAEMVSLPVQILRRMGSAVANNLLGGYSYIAGDEINQWSPMMAEMFERLNQANPNASLSLSGDPLQSHLWTFLGAGEATMQRITRATGLAPTTIQENRRLAPETIRAFGRWFNIPASELPTTTNASRPDLIRSNVLAASEDEMQAQVVAGVQKDLSRGLSPQDITVLASRREQTTQIAERLRQGGLVDAQGNTVKVWNAPDIRDYFAQIRQNPQNAGAIILKFFRDMRRPNGALAVSTIHASQSLEAKSVHLADASSGSFDRGETGEAQANDRGRFAVAATRVAEGGNLSLYSSLEQGGVTGLVQEGYGAEPGMQNLTPTETPAAVALNQPVPVTTHGRNPVVLPAIPAGGQNPNTPNNPPAGGTPLQPQPNQPTPPPQRAIPILNNALVDPASIVNSQIPTAGTVVPSPGGQGHIVTRGGQILFNEREVETLTNRSRDFLARASDFSTGPVPTTPADMAKTIHQRFNDLLNDYVKEVASAVRGRPEEGARVIRATMEKEFMNSVGQAALTDMRSQTGYNPTPDYRGRTYSRSANQISALMNADPELAAEVGRRGTNPGELAGGASQAFTTSLGNYYFGGNGSGGQGGGGGGGGGNNSRGNTMGGPFSKLGGFGKFLYGAYLAKREFNMFLGGEQQDAQAYIKWAQDFQQIAQIGDAGFNALGSDVGIAARQSLGQRFMGQAAQQTFGGFGDIPFKLSGMGDTGKSIARLGAYLGGGLGIGAGVSLGLGMIGVTGGAAIVPGVAIALGSLAVGGVMEARNQWFKQPGEDDWTLTGAIDNWLSEGAVREAKGAASSQAMVDLSNGTYTPGDGMSDADWDFFNKYSKDPRIAAVRNDPRYYGKYLSPRDRALAGVDDTKKKVQDLLNKASAAEVEGVASDDAAKAMYLHKRAIRQEWSEDEIIQRARESAVSGISMSEREQGAQSYASQMGYTLDMPGFQTAMNQYYASSATAAGTARMFYKAQVAAQYGSQFQGFFNASQEGLGTRTATLFGIDTQEEAQRATSWMSIGANFGVDNSGMQYLAGAAQLMPNGYQASYAATIMNSFAVAGVSPEITGGWLSGLSVSNNQMGLAAQIAQGDVGAMSWGSWQTGDRTNRFFDRSGNPMIQRNGNSAMETLRAWQKGTYNERFEDNHGGLSSLQKVNLSSTAAFLGTANPEILKAFEENGTYGLQLLQNQWQYEDTVKSAGVAAAGVRLQQQFYWGSSTWDNPGAGSMWDLENQQVALQRQSQAADFSEQYTRMQSANKYAVAREENQWERMTTSQAYNTWQMEFNQANAIQQRQWTQADWQYQDQTRALQYGWQMEDLDEAIRFSSGRERRKLVRQQDRAALSHNLEEQQIDTTRDRQETLWAREDERYEKSKEYMEELNRLDVESFQQNKAQREENYRLDQQSWSRKKKEWEEQTRIEDEMRTLQRKFQHDQLELQLAQIGNQVEQAKRQKEINDAMAKTQDTWSNMMGEINQMSKYDQAFNALQAARYLLQAADNTNIDPINKLKEIFNTIEILTRNGQNLQRLIDLFKEMEP